MSSNTVLVEEETTEGVPVCGGNLSTPVTDIVRYIDEIHYQVGSRLYIENAD
jgi:hypothetical protein